MPDPFAAARVKRTDSTPVDESLPVDIATAIIEPAQPLPRVTGDLNSASLELIVPIRPHVR